MSSTPPVPSPEMGIVLVTLADGSEVLAEYDGCEWRVHQDNDPDSTILPGDQVIAWRLME